jgi:hypothetical protein
MKKLKIVLLVIFTVGLHGFNSVNAQAESSGQQFVTVEVFEPFMGANPEMIVIDSKGKMTSTELEKVSLKKYSETFGKNTVTVHHEITKWTEKGYKLLTYDKEAGDYILTTIVLIKD